MLVYDACTYLLTVEYSVMICFVDHVQKYFTIIEKQYKI